MTTYAFIELPPTLSDWVTPPGTLFPVRTELADELQRPDDPQPARLCFELERYLNEFPSKRPQYAQAGGQLAFRTAVDLFIHGLKEESLQFYELSLALRPDDLITRLNFAVALHALLYRDAALTEYEQIMARTTPREHLRVWILAAQIHRFRQRPREIVALLAPVAAAWYPPDDEFWELLGDARGMIAPPAVRGLTPVKAPPLASVTKPTTKPPPPPPQSPPPRPQKASPAVACPGCGAALKATSKFCPGCGKPVIAARVGEQPTPEACPHCGAARNPTAKFCGGCGKPSA
jgi:hypothetical protein